MHGVGLQNYFVSVMYRTGIAIGKRTDVADIRRLVARLHPIISAAPLIRLGCDDDGGYLVPDDLDGITACFSPGGNRASFESSLIAVGIRCHLADLSGDTNPLPPGQSTFIQKNVGVINDLEHVTVDQWVAEFEPGDSDLLLQMDIEGAEWSSVLRMSDITLQRFRIIVLECHDLERLMERHSFITISDVFDRLLSTHYIVHIHPNNWSGTVRAKDIVIPRAIELTFVRKDRITQVLPARSFPHVLDRPNTARFRDVPLPDSWYESSGTEA